jgi:heterodisulfide reductase subunit A2
MKTEQDSNQSLPHVIVIGAGIGGIKASLDLARTKHRVTLIDQSSAIGGVLMQLDYQFPNNHCGICRMLPMTEREIGTEFCLRKGIIDQNIQILSHATVSKINGNSGNYQITVQKNQTGVDASKCLSCGECIDICPENRPDGFNESLVLQKAVYYSQPYQTPALPVIDEKTCTKCGKCQKICPTDAIHLEFIDKTAALEDVSAIIVATGFEAFDPETQDVYATKTFSNVLTGIKFERLISSSNIQQAKPIKPSNGEAIKKIAWVQCVGSRNLTINADYCSSACCMMAIKETMLTTEKLGSDVQKDIFYMDMRTYGRDFQRYKDSAERDHNTNFIRCRIHSIEPGANPDDLKISYMSEDGKQLSNEYDLIVLSTGQTNKPLITETLFESVDLEGVFFISSQEQLIDISETIIRSLATVSMVQNLTSVDKNFFPGDLAVESNHLSYFRKRPKNGILICDDNNRVMDEGSWQETLDLSTRLSFQTQYHLLASVSLNEIENQLNDLIQSHQCNRILLGFSNPVLLKQWQQLMLKRPLRFQHIPTHFMDLSSYSGKSDQDQGATDKQSIRQDIVAGLYDLQSLTPPAHRSIDIDQTVLVIGGGPAGLKAAETMAEKNVNVILVEKNDKIGGNVTQIGNPETKQSINGLIDRVQQNARIEIMIKAELVNISGTTGQFLSKIAVDKKMRSIRNGAFIIATGGKSIDTSAYEFGNNDAIITHNTLEAQLIDGTFTERIKSVVLIQCAGSREEPYNYCSKTCCIKNINNAIDIRERFPTTEVFVFYRDIMTYGENEKIYTQARRLGVIFIPFHPHQKPEVSHSNQTLKVSGYDPVTGCEAVIEANLVVLATGVQAYQQDTLTKMLKVKTDQNQFIIEADYKWRPVDTLSPGVFVAGLARNPVNTEGAMQEGSAAAERAYQLLQKPKFKPSDTTAQVNHFLCSACQICVQDCPYQARSFDLESGVVSVDILSCQGCGSCAVVCPNSASSLSINNDISVLNSIETFLSD